MNPWLFRTRSATLRAVDSGGSWASATLARTAGWCAEARRATGPRVSRNAAPATARRVGLGAEFLERNEQAAEARERLAVLLADPLGLVARRDEPRDGVAVGRQPRGVQHQRPDAARQGRDRPARRRARSARAARARRPPTCSPPGSARPSWRRRRAKTPRSALRQGRSRRARRLAVKALRDVDARPRHGYMDGIGRSELRHDRSLNARGCRARHADTRRPMRACRRPGRPEAAARAPKADVARLPLRARLVDGGRRAASPGVDRRAPLKQRQGRRRTIRRPDRGARAPCRAPPRGRRPRRRAAGARRHPAFAWTARPRGRLRAA